MIESQSRILDYFGLFMLIFVFLVLVYGIVYIHDIPYSIAKKRNHPHQDAIHAAGWVSLFMLHALWPFLWIWAMIHKPDLPDDQTFEKQIKAKAAKPEKTESEPESDAHTE